MLRFLCAMLVVSSAFGAEFFNGQAARAVLGQPSFSSHDAGVAAVSMDVSDDLLYVADVANRVLTFDLAKIPAATDDLLGRPLSGCALCGFAPVSTINQTVAPGSSRINVFGKSLAAIDARTHRVLIWHDVTTAAASMGPDVSLDIADPETTEISESTLIDPISVAIDGAHLFVGDAFLHRVLVWKSLPRFSNQPADIVLGQRDFSSRESADVPRADSISRPDALLSDGMNLYVGDSRDRRILVFSPAASGLSGDQLLNSASLSSGPVAPGTLITINGTALTDKSASAPEDATDPLPTKLAGVQAIFDGAALPLLSVSPSEVRTQLPYASGGITSASLYLRVEHPNGAVTTTTPVPVTLAPSSPGLFAFAGPEPRPGMLLHADSATAPDASAVSSDAPASPGETVTIWAAGLHTVSVSADQTPKAGVPYNGQDLTFAPVSASVSGQPAEVVSVSLPQTSIGIYQLRVALPRTLGQSGTAQLLISQDGYTSNAVTFPIRKPQL